MTIAAAELAELMAGVEPIGLDADGATTRLAWTAEDDRAREWFERQAKAIGLRVERDPAGNLWACPAGDGPWWAVGSHLDSVRRGGRFDGALGVVAAFAVAARSRVPLAVISLADEEGARFNTPTFGSRALVGALDVDDVLGRRDDAGVTLGDAMARAGVDPDGLADAPRWLDRLEGFLELHIDQSRDVARAGVAGGFVDRLAARMRLQASIEGEADHAGTTPSGERSDALAAAARLIVAAEDEATGRPGMVFTPARIEVAPNAATTVPASTRLWLDARSSAAADVEGWRSAVAAAAERLAAERRVRVALTTASSSTGTEFPPDVRRAIADGLPERAPGVVCFAGHDAGVIAARRPAGMVLVRNERGISHSPHEHVSLEDAAVAATALLGGVERLAGEGR